MFRHVPALKGLSLFLVVILLLNGCGSGASNQESKSGLQGTITVSGAFALYPLMVQWAEEFQKINPGVRVDVSAGGAGKGMADTLAGAADIGMVSRPVKPEEEAKGAYWVAVAKDAVFAVVSTQNPVLPELSKRGLTKQILTDIYITGKITAWGQVTGQDDQKDALHIYTRSDAAGAADMWAAYVGGTQEKLLGIGVFGDPGIVEAVAKDALGLGYGNLNYVFDAKNGKPVANTVLVPLDVNGNGVADSDERLDTKQQAIDLVANGRYPAPPARLLNLVTKGKPSGATREFLNWILNDGQKYSSEAGYVSLTQEQLTAQREKLR